MQRNLTTQDISWFLDLYEKGQLDLNPPYQRRSVWSPRDRRFFVDTVLNNYPSPPIFLHKTLNEQGRSTYHVVDGQQRLQTIIDFTLNKVRIPDDFADVNLQKKNWDQLERNTRELFWNYTLSVEMLPDVSDAAVRNIFDRINRNSRKLVPQEMRHAKYDGWFIKTAESEAEKEEWRDFGISTTSRIKRMANVQFISELLRVIIKNQIDGFDQDALDELCADYEDLSDNSTFLEDDFLASVENIKSYIRDLLTIQKDIRNFLKVQNHFYSLWSYLALESKSLLSAEEFAPKYVRFLEDFKLALETSLSVDDQKGNGSEKIYRDAVRDYATNFRGASTDLTPRRKRHDALIKAIHGAR
jgi:Protein of unknown function DUF262